MTAIPLPQAAFRPLWRTAQLAGLVLTAALLAGLVQWPEPTLNLLWNMVVPLLPATFLVSPQIWRNVCPLATLNALTGDRVGRRHLAGQLLNATWAVGIVLLVVMVPARRFLFNVNGPALAVTIVAVAALALLAGLVYARRAGFCNALCPVLPVEKLYGQAPLLRVGNARCSGCTLCTPTGCLDLVGGKAVAHAIGPRRRTTGWLLTPFGAFAAAFPGFVIGYFAVQDTGLHAAGAVYLTVAAWVVVAYVATAIGTLLLRARAEVALPALGGIAVAFYYWFAAPTLTTAYGVPGAATVVRALALGLVAGWLWTARPRQHTNATAV
jgi:hypothetical protein